MTIEELKKEAEECMHNALFWLKLPISKENVEQGGSYILKLLEPREKRIAELEKENAELKSGCGMCYRKDKEQLTKAREIIKKMLYVSCNSDVLVQYPNCSEVLQSRVEAENFLKESEVEK